MDKRKPPDDSPAGPRGGTTTVTAKGDFRKNLWISRHHQERLRRWAFKLRRSESDLFRQALDRFLSDLEAQERAALEAKSGRSS